MRCKNAPNPMTGWLLGTCNRLQVSLRTIMAEMCACARAESYLVCWRQVHCKPTTSTPIDICTLYCTCTLSEKLEYIFFLPRIFSCYWTLYNKYFGKIFSALCVDVFPELFRIFPNFNISWYMTKDSEVHLKNCLLIHTCSTFCIYCTAWLV